MVTPIAREDIRVATSAESTVLIDLLLVTSLDFGSIGAAMAQFGAGIVDTRRPIIPSASYLPLFGVVADFDFTLLCRRLGVSVDFVLTTLAASDWVSPFAPDGAPLVSLARERHRCRHWAAWQPTAVYSWRSPWRPSGRSA